MSKTLQILTKARELVSNGWCTGFTAQDAEGNKVHNYDPNALKFPAWAAMDAAFANPIHQVEEGWHQKEEAVCSTGKAFERAKLAVSAAAKKMRGKRAIPELISDEGQEQALELLDTAMEIVRKADAVLVNARAARKNPISGGLPMGLGAKLPL